MADEVDLAQEHQERNLQQALQMARIQAPLLAPRGFCHNCDTPLPPELPFCDKDCADDHERRATAKTRRLS